MSPAACSVALGYGVPTPKNSLPVKKTKLGLESKSQSLANCIAPPDPEGSVTLIAVTETFVRQILTYYKTLTAVSILFIGNSAGITRLSARRVV